MAKRPILEKQARRVERLFSPTPRRLFDLLDWLELHGHADTRGQARKLVLQGKVRSDTHTVGITEVEDKHGLPIKVVDRFLPISYLENLEVTL